MIASRKVGIGIASDDGDILLVVAHGTIILMLVVLQTISGIDRRHGFFSKALTVYPLISFCSGVVWQGLLANGHTQTDHILVVRGGYRVSILLLERICSCWIRIILHFTTRIYLLRHVSYVIFKWQGVKIRLASLSILAIELC